MRNKNVLMIILLLVGAGIGFWGGIKYQQNKTTKAFQSQFADNPFRGGRNQGGGAMGSNTQTGNGANNQRRMGNNQTIGEITSVDAKSITIKSNDGSSTIILLSDKTTVNKATSAQISDLKIGEKVAVFGTPNTDGSISGSSIQLNPNMPNLPSGTPSGTPSKN